ncbi:unnamed protein product [Schistosoma rodhaini]|uniref:Apple domain-containing protein n=1 Tax=Schistosoma rodhaini TaxID=6188 RepID=A0A183QMA9_9TREM|nr:unnamed protein product [Schistosoma rodhaini]
MLLYHLIKKLSIYSSLLNSSCSSNPTAVNPIQNFILLNKTKRFCEANEMCANHGRNNNQIINLIGQNYNLAIECFKNKTFWTRINQMNYLQLNNPNYTHLWIDGPSEPYLIPNLESHLPYRIKRVHNDGYDEKYIAFYNHLDDILQTTLPNRTDEIDVICELEQNINKSRNNDKNHNHFIQMKQFHKCSNGSKEGLFSPGKSFDGCYSYNNELNFQYCAYSCARDEYCLRFYYNHLTNGCILTQYIISLIPSYYPNNGSEWDCYSLNNAN